MTEDQTQSVEQIPTEADALSHKLDAIGWALFLIWVGFAVLADIGWGWGLIGIAAIILGEAGLRFQYQLNVGRFWIALGVLFLLGGLWDLFQVQWPLAPLILIACGIAVLWGALSGTHLMKK